MKHDISISSFYSDLCQEIEMAQESQTFGWEPQDFFTAVMLDYLSESGETEEAVICPFRAYGLQMNAYQFSEDKDSLDIYVSIFSENDTLSSVSRTDIDAAIKRGIQLYRKAANDLFQSFEKDTDTYEFAITVHKNIKNIKQV